VPAITPAMKFKMMIGFGRNLISALDDLGFFPNRQDSGKLNYTKHGYASRNRALACHRTIGPTLIRSPRHFLDACVRPM
jgi:hypothetical protein